MPWIFLQTPSIIDTTVHKPSEYFNRFIKKGDLALRDKTIDKTDGFYFSINWQCLPLKAYLDEYKNTWPPRTPTVGNQITPTTGKHKKSPVFRISELEITETSDFKIYDITFEISCDLFYGGQEDNFRHYGRLEDGVFKTQVVLPLEE
jgi:hypothetical protein